MTISSRPTNTKTTHAGRSGLPVNLPESSLPVINVSQVPQVSPFRYPGGKSWFYPYFRAWIKANQYQGSTLIEPFAGGASIALQSLLEGLVRHAILVEMDQEVSNFWHVVFSENGAQELIRRIQAVNPEEIEQILKAENVNHQNELDRAFFFLLRNRTNFGGITAQGASRLKKGEKNKGLVSRWYPEVLSWRLSKLYNLRHLVSISQEEGVAFLEFAAKFLPQAILFVDPPYLLSPEAPGKRLYNTASVNYSQLFSILARRFRDRFLFTHEPSTQILDFVEQIGLEVREIPMLSRKNEIKNEFVIASSLDWLTPQTIRCELEEIKGILKEIKKEKEAYKHTGKSGTPQLL